MTPKLAAAPETLVQFEDTEKIVSRREGSLVQGLRRETAGSGFRDTSQFDSKRDSEL